MNQPSPAQLGALLIESRVITPQQLEWALQEQQRLNLKSQREFKLGEVLVFSQVISERHLQTALAKQKNEILAPAAKPKESSFPPIFKDRDGDDVYKDHAFGDLSRRQIPNVTLKPTENLPKPQGFINKLFKSKS